MSEWQEITVLRPDGDARQVVQIGGFVDSTPNPGSPAVRSVAFLSGHM